MMLLFVHRRTFHPLGPLPGLIGFVELGLAVALLFAAGVSYLYAAATEPKMASLLPTRRLLTIMTGLTVVRQVYYLCYAIFVGMYSITPQNNTVMPVPVWLPAATAIFSPWTIAICLTMACLTLRQDVGSIRDLVHDWRPEVDVKPAGPLLSHRRRDTDTSWFHRPADGAAVS
jgi:hypothetical protein